MSTCISFFPLISVYNKKNIINKLKSQEKNHFFYFPSFSLVDCFSRTLDKTSVMIPTALHNVDIFF